MKAASSTLFLLLLGATLGLVAQTQPAQPRPREVVSADLALAPQPETVAIASAVPQGKTFVIAFDDTQVARAYPAYSTIERRAVLASPEDLKSIVRETAMHKLAEMFPNGIPSGPASRVKITVKIKLSKPPEVGVSVEW